MNNGMVNQVFVQCKFIRYRVRNWVPSFLKLCLISKLNATNKSLFINLAPCCNLASICEMSNRMFVILILFSWVQRMFSSSLIEQLLMLVIRPHREIYGLDRLGPKKLIVKSASFATYLQINRFEATITSNYRKLQISIFEQCPRNPSFSSSPRHSLSDNQSTLLSKSTELPSIRSVDQHITVFLHSNSGSRIEGLEYVKYLLQYEERVCLFDYSGSGLSEGDYVTMGIRQSEDLENVIKFLKDKYQVDKVNLWGRSMGAVTALLYACRQPNNVSRIVADSPYCNFRQLVKEIVNRKTGLPDFLFGAAIDRIGNGILEKVGVNLMELDLKKHCESQQLLYAIPCLFLTSKDDKLVKAEHVETLYQCYPGSKKIIYLEGSHNKPRPNNIRERCAQFLCEKALTSSSSNQNIELKKSKYLKVTSKKYSLNGDALSTTKFSMRPPKSSNLFQHQSNASVNSNTQDINSSQNKKKLDEEVMKQIQSPTPNAFQKTKREENSAGKLGLSKVSLSQLKKNQGQALNKPMMRKESHKGSESQSNSRPVPDKSMILQFKRKVRQFNAKN